MNLILSSFLLAVLAAEEIRARLKMRALKLQLKKANVDFLEVVNAKTEIEIENIKLREELSLSKARHGIVRVGRH